MNEREFKEFDEILRKQQEEVKHSKAAARKLLTQLGIMHLLVPKGPIKRPRLFLVKTSYNIVFFMYPAKPGLLIAFHGCEEAIRNDIVAGNTMLKASENGHDWLGVGAYFWENNYEEHWTSPKILPVKEIQGSFRIGSSN